MVKAWIRAIKMKVDRMLEKRLQSEQIRFNQGMIQAKMTRPLSDIRDLSEVEWQAFSQWGEDGIIDWLVAQLPEIPKTFIEFGVEDYREANTRMLLKSRNWKGLVIDGSRNHVEHIKTQDIYWKHELSARCDFINRENINRIFEEEGFTGEIGLLSIDIDGNDYWIWECIDVVNPILVVCEYNAVLGDVHALSIPYDAGFIRGNAHPSNTYYGASIGALRELGVKKGYTLLGTNLNGSSGFFVRDDFASQIIPKIKSVHNYPSRFREARNEQGELIFTSGENRCKAIGHLPFVETISQSKKPLKEFFPLYSDQWRS
jgi:hypothetical protein